MDYTNNLFWEAYDKLIFENNIVIDRPKGSKHPKYNFIYPFDYGYISNTSSMDSNCIDVCMGTVVGGLNAIIVTIDLLKKDSEIKLLLNCSTEEKENINEFFNSTEYMNAILIKRN